jgi:glycosyltransferase involved in cell wall biosynthesis
MRILILSHGHPDLSAGGAERAAYSLFQQLKSTDGVEPVFVARVDPSKIGHDGWFGAFRARKDEFLWTPPAFDWFRMTSFQPDLLLRQVEAIVKQFKPDVVHIHHYFFFGLEIFESFKSSASCKVVLTLHEYGLICAHNGQMVKRESMRLCHASSPSECATCYPEQTSGKFFLRERLAKRFLNAVDEFVSPSDFLKSRYSDWGIQSQKIHVIENLLPPGLQSMIRSTSAQGSGTKSSKIRFGYFGQINPFKGANVLLDAVSLLPDSALDSIEVIVFGANLEEQPEQFRTMLSAKLNSSERRPVSLFGPYRNEDVMQLMHGVDWIVVPSIWWENSPIVIQEAKMAGRPILVSNIGGMAEKVSDGVDGLHFLAGSALDCASKIELILSGRVKVVPPPLDLTEVNSMRLNSHLRLYGAK